MEKSVFAMDTGVFKCSATQIECIFVNFCYKRLLLLLLSLHIMVILFVYHFESVSGLTNLHSAFAGPVFIAYKGDNIASAFLFFLNYYFTFKYCFYSFIYYSILLYNVFAKY